MKTSDIEIINSTLKPSGYFCYSISSIYIGQNTYTCIIMNPNSKPTPINGPVNKTGSIPRCPLLYVLSHLSAPQS